MDTPLTLPSTKDRKYFCLINSRTDPAAKPTLLSSHKKLILMYSTPSPNSSHSGMISDDVSYSDQQLIDRFIFAIIKKSVI